MLVIGMPSCSMYVECGSNRCTSSANFCLLVASSSSFASVFFAIRGPAMSWFDSAIDFASLLSQSSAPCVRFSRIGLPSVFFTPRRHRSSQNTK